MVSLKFIEFTKAKLKCLGLLHDQHNDNAKAMVICYEFLCYTDKLKSKNITVNPHSMQTCNITSLSKNHLNPNIQSKQNNINNEHSTIQTHFKQTNHARFQPGNNFCTQVIKLQELSALLQWFKKHLFVSKSTI